jgi:hypothetical protein
MNGYGEELDNQVSDQQNNQPKHSVQILNATQITHLDFTETLQPRCLMCVPTKAQIIQNLSTLRCHVRRLVLLEQGKMPTLFFNPQATVCRSVLNRIKAKWENVRCVSLDARKKNAQR